MVSVKHQEILDTAARLFSESGYRNTSMRELSDKVGIQAGSLYSHIESKEDLLYELVKNVGQLLVDAAASADGHDGSAAERLELFIANQIGLLQHHQQAISVLTFEWRVLKQEHRDEIVKLRNASEQHLSHILTDGIRTGEFSAVYEKWARLAILSVGNWASQWFAPDGDLSPRQLGEEFARLFVLGLEPR